MKKLLFLIPFLSCGNSIFSQTYEDVVYLKNGSEIHGMILEQIPNESLKIKSGPSIFVYKMDEVLKILKVEVKESNNYTSNNTNIDKPDIKTAENYFINRIDKESGGKVQFISIEKINGQETNLGVLAYTLEYKLIFQPKTTVKVSAGGFGIAIDWDNFSVSTEPMNEWDKTMGYNHEYRSDKGILVTGRLQYQMTDNGWVAQGYENLSQQVLSTNYFGTTTSENVLSTNDNTSKFVATIGNLAFLQTQSHPFGMIDYVMLSDSIPFMGNSGNADTKLISSKVSEAFTTHANLAMVSNNFQKPHDSLISLFRISINEVQINKESGYNQYNNNSPYSGYKAKIFFTIKIKFGESGRTLEKMETAVGGNPMTNNDQNGALTEAATNMREYLQVWISYCFGIYSKDYTIIDESKNGNIKRIQVTEVGNYIDQSVKYSAIIFTDYSISKGTYEIKNWIAKAEIDKNKSSGSTIELKISDGKESIRPAITDGKTIHIMFVPTPLLETYK